MGFLFWREPLKLTEYQGVAVEKNRLPIQKVYVYFSIEFVQQNFTIYPYISTK